MLCISLVAFIVDIFLCLSSTYNIKKRNLHLFMSLAMWPNLDSQESNCSQTSVLTFGKGKFVGCNMNKVQVLLYD